MVPSALPLTDLYNQFFRLKEAPFSIAPNPRFLFMSARHQEALAHLLYGIDSGGGFVALTGEVGTGKTTLCHRLLEEIPDEIDIALILNPKLSSVELLASICDELAIHYPSDCSSLKSYTDLLNQHLLSAHSRGRRTVLMIDEAQNLNFEVLEQVRLLTNLETTETKLLQIILIGQPELKQLLERDELRQLNQRITARYHLTPLTLSETDAYIRHRLSISGGDPDIFSGPAIRKVYRLSKGIPRLINVLCDRSLLGAYAIDQQRITTGIVTRAAAETLPNAKKRFELFTPALWLTLAVLVAAGVGVYYLGVPLSTPFNIGKPQRPVPAELRIDPEKTHEIAKRSTSDPATPKSTNSKEPGASANPLEAEERLSVNESRSNFDDTIRNPELSIERALFQLLQVWNLEITSSAPISCDWIKLHGLRCLPNSGTWYDIVNFNRPVILEFSLPGEGNRYIALSGLSGHQAVFRIGGEQMTFSSGEILTRWQGFYLLVWKPPQPDLVYLRPGQNSEPIIWLRETLANFDGQQSIAKGRQLFDDDLRARVIAFQKNRRLVQDGVVGPKTIVHLKNTLNEIDFPQLNTNGLLSAEKSLKTVGEKILLKTGNRMNANSRTAPQPLPETDR